MKKVYNFCAGPAMLPVEVMQQAQSEFIDFAGLGVSVMELSHRGKEYMVLAAEAEQDLRDLLNVPDNYKVLFMHGGGRGQFAAVPLNLLGGDNKKADYLISGVWSKAALTEAHKYADAVAVAGVQRRTGSFYADRKPQFRADAAYVHYCPNETIEGIEMFDIPDTGDIPLVADLLLFFLARSMFLSSALSMLAHKRISALLVCVLPLFVRDDC